MRKPKQLESERKYVRVDRAENRGVNVEFNAVLKNDIYRNPSNKTLFRRGALPKKEAKFGIFWCNPEVHYQWKQPPIRQAYLLPPDQRFRFKLHFMEQQNPSIPPRPAPTVAPAAAAVSPAAATVPPAPARSRPAGRAPTVAPAAAAVSPAAATVPPAPARSRPAGRARSRAPSAAVPAAARSRSTVPAAAHPRSAAPAAHARARSASPGTAAASSASPRAAALGHAPVLNTPAPAPDRSRAPVPPRAPAAVPARVEFDRSKTRHLLPFLLDEYPNLDWPAQTEEYIRVSYNRHLADQTVLDQEHCLEMMLSCHYKFQMGYLLIDMRHRAEEFAVREKCPIRRSPKYDGRFEMAADDVRTLIRDILGSSFHPCIFTKMSQGDRLLYQVMFYVNSSMQPVQCDISCCRC